MATALMVIGMIGLLAAIIIPVAAAVFTGNSGGDGLLASLYFGFKMNCLRKASRKMEELFFA